MTIQDPGALLEVRFWGVRGSIPTAHADNLEFGGNTACVEVRGPEGTIVIDGGTGARKLGATLATESDGEPVRLHLLITHFHWDHIQGIPFFVPLYSPQNQVTFCSGVPGEKIREVLEGQMASPYFPVPFSMLGARRDVMQVTGEPCEMGGVKVRAFPMNHPQGAWGFRLEAGGRAVVHACDVEHGHPQLDRTLREFAEGADLLIYDSQFTPEEYDKHIGWGHSTWLEATRVAREAGVKRLVLFHHHPDHDDLALVRIVDDARAEFANTDAAREGWSIRV